MEAGTYGLSPKPTTGKTLSVSRKRAGAQVPLSSKEKEGGHRGRQGLLQPCSVFFLSADQAKQWDQVTGMLLPLQPCYLGLGGGLGCCWGDRGSAEGLC